MSAADVPMWLEWAKSIGIFLSTTGIAYIGQSIREVRKELHATNVDLRDLKHIVVGVDGNNGIRGVVKEHETTLERIVERNRGIDAVTEYERQHYKGEERRHSERRARDVIRQMEEELKERDQ